MTARSWVRRLFARTATSPIRKEPPRTRLAVEGLEDRTVPATFLVTNTLDDGSIGSLRWAVDQANATPGADAVGFDAAGVFGTPRTITLTQGQLTISDAVTIAGPDAALAISGNNASRIFNVDNGQPGAGANVGLSDLSLTGGRAGEGGAILNYEALGLTRVGVSGNTAFSKGGGISSYGGLALTNSGVSDNTTGGDGGGIYNSAFLGQGVVSLNQSGVFGNSAGGSADGGGIYNLGRTVLFDSDVSLNSAGRGGGIYNGSGGTVSVVNFSTIGHNSAYGNFPGGGGIYNLGTVGVNNSFVLGNSAGYGGGVYNGNSGTAFLSGAAVFGNTANGSFEGAGAGGGIYNSGTATVTNSTLDNNLSSGGGGIFNYGSVTLLNSTLSDNLAAIAGGGIYTAAGAAAMTSATVSGSRGGGIYITGGTVTLNNTIVANSTFGGDVHGTLTGSHNLIEDGSGGLADTIAADPLLGPLAYNGWNRRTTATLALNAGSPAIDAGDNSLVPAGVTLDQRGSTRVYGGTVDIGAVEYRPLATTAVVTSSTPSPTYGDQVWFTVTVAGEYAPHGSAYFVIDGGAPVPGISAGTTLTTESWACFTSTLAAGAHTVEALFVGTDGFVDSSAALNGGQIVNKLDATVVFSGYAGGTYDCAAHAQTVTITGVTGDQLYTTSLTGTNAGTYTQPWSYSNPNYHDVGGTLAFAIAKADASVVVTPYAVTYDGRAHTATVSTITGVNGETGGTVGTVTLGTTHTSAGTYASDSWSFTGTANYNDVAVAPITNVINKAALTITANDDFKIFGTLKTFGSTAFTQSGLVIGDIITGVTETSTGAPAAAAAGTYDIVPSAVTGTGLGNYDISYVNGTLTVFPAISVPAAQTAYENVDLPIGGISIGSGLSGSLTLTLTVGYGTLTLGTTTGLTVTGNGTGSVSLTGSAAALNAALATLVYRGLKNFSGADALSLTVGDGSISSSASVAITVVSIARQDADLKAGVKALQTAKVLTAKQANILLASLSLMGNSGDVGKLQSFLNDVRGYLRSGVLTQAQADALLGLGNTLLLGLTVKYGG